MQKILGTVILMLLVPTPSVTSSVNVKVDLWETEQVALVSSINLRVNFFGHYLPDCICKMKLCPKI